MGALYPRRILRPILRRLHKFILTDELRGSLTSLSLLKLFFLLRNDHPSIEPIADFSAKRILVLAPHMDDEALGCGGILKLHALAGATITVIYMTDGRKGDPNLYRQNLSEAAIAEKELALCATRKNEAARAAKVIGIKEQIFLDHLDGQLKPLPDVVERVRNILQERRPLIIYHPSIFDLHPDHWATNRVLAAATKMLQFSSDWHPVYRGYEVWMPVVVNRLADITQVIQTKQEAIAQFASQLSHTDFARTILGLNTYRSLYHTAGHGYAEAFYESVPDLYSLLFQRLLDGNSRSA